jgi:toxin ParE1/3/4
MNSCILSPTALRDLNDISSYFANQNIDAGERVLALFTEKCTRLIDFPNMGKSYDFLGSGLRGIPLEGYIIFYRFVEIVFKNFVAVRLISRQNQSPNLLRRHHLPL